MKRMTMKFMALALLVVASSAALHAQVQFAAAGNNKTLRQEGLTEAIGEVTLSAVSAGTIVTGSYIDVTYSVPINTPVANVTNANLASSAGCATTVALLGTAPDTRVVRISFTANCVHAVGNSIVLFGLRANANAAIGVNQVVANLSSFSPNPANFISYFPTQAVVGSLSSSLSQVVNGAFRTGATTFLPGAVNGQNSGTGLGVSSSASGLQTCAITRVAAAYDPTVAVSAANTASFFVSVTENFAAALLTQAQELALAGSPVPANGTKLRITLSNVPSGIQIIAPAVNSLAATTTLAAALDPSSPATVDSSANGTSMTWLYNITASNTNVSESLSFGFRVGSTNTTSTSSTVSIPALGGSGATIAAATSLMPIDATTTNVIRFADNSTTGNVLSITDCNTRLLFTWVATVGDVETGVAIANTSSDDAAFGSGSSNGATSQNGTCTLTGYPSAGGTPVSFTTATINAGATLPFLLSQTTGFANFSGYVLTVCNFQNAHAFAYITNGRGTVAGPTTAQGYLANVVPGGTRGAESLSN